MTSSTSRTNQRRKPDDGPLSTGGLNGSTQHFVLDAEGGVYVEEPEEPSTFKTTKMQNRPKRVKSLVKVWTSFRSRLFTVWLRTVAKDPIREGLCACVASTG